MKRMFSAYQNRLHTVATDDGSSSPTLKTLSFILLAWCLVQTAAFGQVVHEATITGTATSSASVSSATVTGVTGDLYLAAIASRNRETVTAVSGLGLTWQPVDAQCSGRGVTMVELWWAQGSATGGAVTANFNASVNAAVIAVSRFSGVDGTNPIGNSISGNTLGADGACSGGTDNAAYSFSVSVSAADNAVYSAAAMRNKTHTPGAAFSERAEISAGSGGDVAGLAVQDQPVASPGSIAVDGNFSSAVDWSVVGVEIKSGSGGGGNIPPTVSLTAPADGAVFAEADTVNMTANAADSDGSVIKVEFYRDTTKLGEDTTSPYEYAWINPAAGSYSLTARAIDDSGAVSTSAAVNITVQSGNSVVISFQDGSEPSTNYDGARDTYIYGQNAGNNYGTVNELKVDGDGTDQVALLKWDISAIPTGSVVQDAEITLYITNDTNDDYFLYEIKREWSETDVTWDDATASTQWDTPGGMGVADRGSDTLGTVKPPNENVTYTIPLNADGIAVVQSWVNTPAANYGFWLGELTSDNRLEFLTREKGTDPALYHPKLTVTYNTSGGGGNTPPSILLTAPADGTAFTEGDPITITANADDSDGSVSKVAFYEGSNLLGEDTAAPYEHTWNTATPGSYNLSAVATDDLGSTATSATVTITVNAAGSGVTVSFQEGNLPDANYNGVSDTEIKAVLPDNTAGGDDEVAVDGGSNLMYSLLKWDLSSLPTVDAVQSAEISLYITNTTEDAFYIYALNRPWSEAQATWNNATDTTAWETAGAKGPSDRGNDTLGTVSPGSSGAYTVALNAAGLAAVKSWINTPAANYGLLIGHDPSSDKFEFFTSEEGDTPSEIAQFRPKLTLTYVEEDTTSGDPPIESPEALAMKTFYYIKDHLGSTRAVIDESGNVKEAYDYYPFGLKMPGRIFTSGSGITKNKFTGKERDDETGWDYFGARYYHPALGKWLAVDPLFDDYAGWSPYNYSLNNPVVNYDPDGMAPEKSSKRGREIKFIAKHPMAASFIGPAYLDEGRNISSVSARFAIKSGLGGGLGSQRNALRHTVWQATITQQFEEGLATDAGNSHEINPNAIADNPNAATEGFINLADADQYVDLQNNIIGRDLGKAISNASVKVLAVQALNIFRDKGLWTVVKVGNRFVARRTKITTEQYNQAITNINNLSKDGFSEEEINNIIKKWQNLDTE